MTLADTPSPYTDPDAWDPVAYTPDHWTSFACEEVSERNQGDKYRGIREELYECAESIADDRSLDGHRERCRFLVELRKPVKPLDRLPFTQTTDTGHDEGPNTWEPVDLANALKGVDIPGPELLARDDGANLWYRGRIHWLQGEPESCKSWLALVGVAQTLANGGRVLWVDYEDDDRGVVARLLALSVSPDVIADRFQYVRPEEPLATVDRYTRETRYTRGHIALTALLDTNRYDLAVIDGVTEAMVTEGLDMMSNPDIATWMRRLLRVLADSGAAVVAIDHVTKSKDDRGRYAIGGQHKLAGVTGAVYTLTTHRPFARARSDAHTGVIILAVTKDRPGHVRAAAPEGKVAVLELTSYPDGGISYRLRPGADAQPEGDVALAGRILQYLAVYDGATTRAIEDAVTGNREAIRACLQWMADPFRAWIDVRKIGNAHHHHLTDAGHDATPQTGPR